MGKNSKIDWTHHTFNPWWGCEKVSTGCDHCYAQIWAARMGMRIWGHDAERRFFGDQHWREPLRWNQSAERQQERQKVFCSSMADVFEERKDLDPLRERLWSLIANTPWLDWLLVTKRPECVPKMVPWNNDWPAHVWLGTTAENQECAMHRLPYLLDTPAKVRFVSCEPLVGAVDLGPWIGPNGLDWVIAGGESGARARPMQPKWVEKIYQQCKKAGVSFFFKQWGTFGQDGMHRSKKDNGNLFQGNLVHEYPDAHRTTSISSDAI
ncbi:MAG: phage Gp37/Gp68 family protein [Magnetococcus sp. DMHC-1]|nr:phage Gp37/Gp68 family protein [Magnetococcales bacterium]